MKDSKGKMALHYLASNPLLTKEMLQDYIALSQPGDEALVEEHLSDLGIPLIVEKDKDKKIPLKYLILNSHLDVELLKSYFVGLQRGDDGGQKVGQVMAELDDKDREALAREAKHECIQFCLDAGAKF